MKQRFRFARSGPDFLMDELTEALKSDAWFEFNPLFLEVYGKLRDRKAAGGGQEMLRLRMYEKLQNLVQRGAVQRSGKTYRGNASALATLKNGFDSSRSNACSSPDDREAQRSE